VCSHRENVIIRYRGQKVQYKENAKTTELSAICDDGRIVAIDPGTKRVGVAVCDELRLIATPLPTIDRKSWKKLLSDVQAVIATYDAAALVIGLPLNTDGSESPMSLEARNLAAKFRLSLNIPVFFQDERVTSYEARKNLWNRGVPIGDTKKFVDSEAAAIILTDFLDRLRNKN
jgi:putative holliday junction resolvase